MKVTVELECEQIESLVKQDLITLLDCLQNDLGRIEENQRGYVFHTDWQEDLKEVKKHIKAFKRVLKYYGWEEL